MDRGNGSGIYRLHRQRERLPKPPPFPNRAPMRSHQLKSFASVAALCTILPASGCASAQTPPARHDVSRVRMAAMRDTIVDSLEANKNAGSAPAKAPAATVVSYVFKSREDSLSWARNRTLA